MFSKPKGWLPAGLWKPKNPHSLEHMKYLYNVLSKIQTVNEGNRGLLVETLRQIAEILIWGDQNDSSVFDFFLEKNMLGYFLKIMRQKYGRYVCVQLLQTLNILFENISNETSLYYLLSNNHINSIIVHKFDFSDEEIMAYYISFLKTLSLKLNTHTVHFFYNEHTNDFPLYTEGIKFFNHSEIMVRNAVRTLTLNVYKELSHDANDQCWCLKSDTQNCHTHMDDKSMLKFIKDKTAAPYFFNLVWFIGSHILELDSCVRNDAGHNSRNRLGDLVAEHLDHMHYMNDILNLGIVALNDCLTDHLLNRLLIPLYVYSLTKRRKYSHGTDENPHISSVVSLFLLTQVFLIINHAPLVRQLAGIVFNGDIFDAANESNGSPSKRMVVRGFAPPNETLEQSLEISTRQTGDGQEANSPDDDPPIENSEEALQSPPPGINQELMDSVMMPTERSASKYLYNVNLIERLVKVIMLSCKNGSKVRLATLELCILLLKQLLHTQSDQSPCFIQDSHMAWIESAREESILQIRNFYKGEEIFLDMFEDEYRQLKSQPLNVEYLTMDHNILLTPTGTPMTGIEFTKRLPCGEVERARRAIRVFFLLRELSLSLRHETDRQLPLTKPERMISTNGVLDLNNSDLIACTVMTADNQKVRRFLAIDIIQMILVEPDTKRLGWGVARFVGFLQDIEVSGDRDDSRILHITIHKQNASRYNRGTPLLSAKLAFDDHIRCMAAKQRLTKGRIKARMCKMQCIARLLELPDAKQAHSYNQASHAGTSRSRRSLQQSASEQPTQPPTHATPTAQPQVMGHPHPRRPIASDLCAVPHGLGTSKEEVRVVYSTGRQSLDKNPSGAPLAPSPSEGRRKAPRSREGPPE
ncbi:PREDICTED: protein CLEC16A-like [Priapulus caudatus]|uniref:Protein CLEC16A-like n=1 Tax=Priapulus caudatus TaxID=37621 RepID=A0ABM1DP99_PRICU|nr:PREDICTED: protein CLEC16A-like [Priapulus caudatus]